LSSVPITPVVNLLPVSNTPVANNWNKTRLLKNLRVNLKEKIYLNVISTNQRCPNKIIKTFLIEELFLLPPVSMTPVVHLEL
jgi:hypothetical protein